MVEKKNKQEKHFRKTRTEMVGVYIGVIYHIVIINNMFI